MNSYIQEGPRNSIAYEAKLCSFALTPSQTVALEDGERGARVNHESYRREAATGYEEILKIEPFVPAET